MRGFSNLKPGLLHSCSASWIPLDQELPADESEVLSIDHFRVKSRLALRSTEQCHSTSNRVEKQVVSLPSAGGAPCFAKLVLKRPHFRAVVIVFDSNFFKSIEKDA
jgi:hypothetical protein